MKCPNCKVLVSANTAKVMESRPTYLRWARFLENGSQIDSTRRRRVCLQCNHVWTTYEITKEELDRMETVGATKPETKKVIQAYSAAIEVLENAMAAALEKDEPER